MSSNHDNVLPQEKQPERSFTIERPVPYRKTKTFKKLPMRVPSIKTKK